MVTPRPPHEPIALRCPTCAAPLSIKDERALLVVCGNCDSQLALEGTLRDGLRVLSGRTGSKVSYDLKLGQPFLWQGLRYEVIARTCWIEEGSFDYTTRVYALYHPRRALLFLDEYHGTWTLMHKTHAMPQVSLSSLGAGLSFQTGDGRKWRCEERVERQLVHVDGCLPWISRVGENVVAFECSGARGATYEVERAGDEIECFEGREIPASRLPQVLPGVEIADAARRSPAARKRGARVVLGAGLFGALLHGLLAIVAASAGEPVMEQHFLARSVSGEVLSEPFELSGDGLVGVDLRAPSLDNAWMSGDIALVKDEDDVLLVDDFDLSYYHGVEGGESWSEGSRDERLYFGGLEPGRYRVLLRAVSNLGETETASEARHDMRVQVVEGVHRVAWVIPGIVVSLIVALAGWGVLHALKEAE